MCHLIHRHNYDQNDDQARSPFGRFNLILQLRMPIAQQVLLSWIGLLGFLIITPLHGESLFNMMDNLDMLR